MFLAAEILTATSTVGLTVGQLLAVMGSVVGAAALGTWWLSGRFSTLATKNELHAIESKLESRFDRFLEKIDERFDKIDARFEKVDERFERLNTKLDRLSEDLITIASNAAVAKDRTERKVG